MWFKMEKPEYFSKFLCTIKKGLYLFDLISSSKYTHYRLLAINSDTMDYI